ncbi:NUDIX domain-containing protein [Paenibacillus mesophilus]|uniref:NUDIX domain-containing protein n=1 Tax=Paenibacillus mesophilus TaxID=2582849 RepID=UPI00110D953B|nr:NUDIX domain-containing protein [Paenibacillus mesophilus]TMV50133.1 NUDIX domain-containing protein [Paenibacillus mesophilus]
MRIVRTENNVQGIPQPNRTRTVVTAQLPDEKHITGAFVLAFLGNELVLTQLKERGWDIPGGHLEPGESPVEAMKRELYEEAGAVVDRCGLLAYEEITLLGDKPAQYKYPYPDSYMVFYWATVSRLDDLPESAETHGRGLFDPDKARQIAWIQSNLVLYEEAAKQAAGAARE